MVLVNIDDVLSIVGEDSDAAREILDKLCRTVEPARTIQTGVVVTPEQCECKPGTYMRGGNSIPRSENGTTYHLGVKEGEIHPRILTVGSPQRARIIGKLLENAIEFESNRLMLTISGFYKGVPISICACLMGAPNFDMFYREASNVIKGPMAMIRLGTCGILNASVNPGQLMIASKGSVYTFRNYLYFDGAALKSQQEASKDPYLFSNAVPCDNKLTSLLHKTACKEIGKEKVCDALNACGESFYSCQGRNDPLMLDYNENVISTLDSLGVDFIDMETHQLFHLSKMRKVHCAAASCCIGIVNRKDPNKGIDSKILHEMELQAGKIVLEALAQYQFD